LCALTIVFNLRVGLPVCFPVFWRPLLTPRVQNIFAGTGMDPDFDQAVKEELSLPDGSTDGLVEVDTLTPELYAAIFAFPTPIQVEHLTPVHYAAATGKFDEVKRLLEEGAEYPQPTALLPSPLCIAAMHPPHYRMVTYLCSQQGARPLNELPAPWLDSIPLRTACALSSAGDTQEDYDATLIGATLNIKCLQMLSAYAQGGMDDDQLVFALERIRREVAEGLDESNAAAETADKTTQQQQQHQQERELSVGDEGGHAGAEANAEADADADADFGVTAAGGVDDRAPGAAD